MIGGKLDARAYALLAQRRSTDPTVRAVLDLAAQGRTLEEIATALRLSVPAVVSMLVVNPAGGSST